jgi:hypothetical protein
MISKSLYKGSTKSHRIYLTEFHKGIHTESTLVLAASAIVTSVLPPPPQPVSVRKNRKNITERTINRTQLEENG